MKTRIQQLLNVTGLNIKEFSKKYGISYATVCDWKYGRRRPPEYVIQMLEKIVTTEQSENKSCNENDDNYKDEKIRKLLEENEKLKELLTSAETQTEGSSLKASLKAQDKFFQVLKKSSNNIDAMLGYYVNAINKNSLSHQEKELFLSYFTDAFLRGNNYVKKVTDGSIVFIKQSSLVSDQCKYTLPLLENTLRAFEDEMENTRYRASSDEFDKKQYLSEIIKYLSLLINEEHELDADRYSES